MTRPVGTEPEPHDPADGPAASPPPAGPAPSAAAPTCLRCGYDLRGLTEESGCPECGLPVRASLEGTPLLHAPPAWLRQVGAACAFEAFALAGLLAYGAIQRFHLLPQEPWRMVLAIAVEVFPLLAAWMIARPEPGAREATFSRRRLVRLAVLARLAQMALFYWLTLSHTPSSESSLFLLLLASYASDVLVLLLWVLYLRRQADRLAQPWLGLNLGFAFVGWAVCVGVSRLLPALLYSIWLIRRRPHGFPYFGSSTGAEYGWWAFTVYLVVVLLLFRRAFRRAAGPVSRGANSAAAGDEEAGVL